MTCVMLDCGAQGLQPSVRRGILSDDGAAAVFVRHDQQATSDRPCCAQDIFINFDEREAADSRKPLFITI